MGQVMIHLMNSFGGESRPLAMHQSNQRIPREHPLVELGADWVETVGLSVTGIIEPVRNTVDIRHLQAGRGKTVRDRAARKAPARFRRVNRSSAAAATHRPSITRAAAESWPCEIRYSRSSSPGQCSFLKGTANSGR